MIAGGTIIHPLKRKRQRRSTRQNNRCRGYAPGMQNLKDCSTNNGLPSLYRRLPSLDYLCPRAPSSELLGPEHEEPVTAWQGWATTVVAVNAEVVAVIDFHLRTPGGSRHDTAA